MTSKANEYRPGAWGFFVCVTIALILFVLNYAVRKDARSDWEAIQASSELNIHNAVTNAFKGKVDELMQVAANIRNDITLLDQLRGNGEVGAASVFEQLQRKTSTNEFTIDIVDPRGSIVAWAGRSITTDYASLLPRNSQNSFTVILQSGLHTYLSAGLIVGKKDFYVVVSRPLELQYPISNRFVNRVSFSEELSGILKTEAWIALNTTSQIHSHKQTHFVLLRDSDGRTIGYVFYVPESLNSRLQAIDAGFSKWINGSLSVGLVFLGLLIWIWSGGLNSPWPRPVLATILIWTIRISWREANFPSILFGPQFFDSTLYASAFPLGLTSSVGELFLTLLAVALNVTILWSISERYLSHRERSPQNPSFKVLVYVVTFALFMLSLWALRGYSEAVRTFVFDSTLKYHDPSVTVPDLPVIVMHINILLLTLSLFVWFCFVLTIYDRILSTAFPWKESKLVSLSLIYVVCLGLFVWIDQPLQFPIYFPVLVFVVAIAFEQWLKTRVIVETRKSHLMWQTLPVLVLVSFVISVPILDARLHGKERQQVQLYAENLLRPVDSWLSFVLVDGLRSVANRYPSLVYEPVEKRGTALAFSLWAQTLMSREGYNSGIILYDKDGKETGRFTVGMSTFEQRELLTKLFDNEEEVVQVVERLVSGASTKSYGIWSTLRDENNDLVGSVALLAVSSQHSLFRGETAEPLRSVAGTTFESTIRKVAVSEFDDGYLTNSGLSEWYRGMPLSARVRGEIGVGDKRFVWVHEQIGQKEYENLYASYEQRPNKIIAVSLETLDLRWHLFNMVKMFLVYAAVLLGVILIRWIVLRRKNEPVQFGFREKLVTAFGILGLIPLFLLGYYNRHVAADRIQENLERTLSADLDLVERRIVSSLLDESDFERGVGDDFCEGVASELGVDFAVFRKSRLLSSSRPELYQSAILDSRIPGGVFADVALLGKQFFVESETVGEVEYAVGYKPLYFNDRLLGVVAVPTLYRQKEIDEELAQRNAFVVGIYAAAFGIVLVVSFVFANRLSRPLRDLTAAARQVGKGDLEVKVRPTSTDEIGDLAKTFNAMVDELRRSREELKHAEREVAWKEMAKQVAHEIRNPLTPMKLSVQHLRQAFKDKARDREKILHEVTKTIIEQIDTLTRIASEFSNFARMPQRRFERLNVLELLSEGVSLFKDVRGIEFRTKFSDTPIHLVADKDELRRVIVNLLRNSVQAMERGGVITVDARLADHRCVVRISDTGAGIPPEIRPKIFEPNFSTKTDGMGLGLAISQKTIQDLGGSITFESTVGKGTTFEINIPV